MDFTRLIKPFYRSFFLFGPRGVGKSTWLKKSFALAPRLDLLEPSTFLELQRHPENLEARIGKLGKDKWIIIDEVQKVPVLLDEVHRLIEAKKWNFVLSGSSARKLKRGAANLLGGRALTLHMESLVFPELGKHFDLEKVLEFGSLPLVVKDHKLARQTLDAYVHTYLKEEIREEGIVRKLDPFVRCLEVAGILNGQILNLQNISREAAVPRSSLDVYLQILEETLIGYRLAPYQCGAKLRERSHPKFYFFDCGVARAAGGLIHDPLDPVSREFALETMIYHELRVYNQVRERHRGIFYYAYNETQEIDFIIETRKKTHSHPPSVVTIEVKTAKKWQRKWEKSSRSLSSEENIHVQSSWGIYGGSQEYVFDHFRVVPIETFLKLLWEGKVF